MLSQSSRSMANVLRKQSSRASSRGFILPALSVASTVANRILASEISLADKMENGELHKPMTTNERELEQANGKYKPLFVRPEPNYEKHVPLHPVEKFATFVGSAVGAFLHPERNEFIVALGESTAFEFVLNELRTQMLNDETGRLILKERPRMTSQSLDLEKLKSFPQNSLGRSYVEWLEREGVSPDTREPVRYIDDEELAYVMQRYRECHDFYHTITGLPIVREGEIALKLFEFLNLKIPMAGMGAVFAPMNIVKGQRDRLFNIFYPWAIQNSFTCKPLINVYWEKILDMDIDVLRQELGIEKPPDMRDLRKKYKLQRQSKQAV